MSFATASEIYKGVDKNGNVIFSDKPIPNSVKQNVIELNKTPLTPEQIKQADTRQQQLMNSDKILTEKLKQLNDERRQVRNQIQDAQIAVDNAQKALDQAMARNNRLLHQCQSQVIPANGVGNGGVNCQFSSLDKLQADLANAKTKLQQLRLQFDRLRKQ